MSDPVVIGNATLYRRFPTKEALVRAIFEDILDEIERMAAASSGEKAPSTRTHPRSRSSCARAACSLERPETKRSRSVSR